MVSLTLLLLLLLLNVIAFELETFVGITVVAHRSSFPLRLSLIMQGKIKD